MFSLKILEYLFDLVDNDTPADVMYRKAALQCLSVAMNEQQQKVPEPLGIEHPSDVYEYLIAYPYDHKVAMIKWIRSVTGMGLKEAKDLSESNYDVHHQHGGFKIQLSIEAFEKGSKEFVYTGATVSKKSKISSVTALPVMIEMVDRSCFLIFDEDSKTVVLKAIPPAQEPGTVVVEVKAKIPKSMFQPQVLRANINLPEGAYLNHDALVDLQQAIGMSHGTKVELVVVPNGVPTK